MGLWRNLCALVALLTLTAAPARAELNKEGFWDVARNGEGTACLAMLNVEGGALFAFHAIDGQVTFAVAGKKRWPKATSGVLATDKVRFDFAPTIDKDFLSFDENLNDKALAALREAEDLVVGLDGKQVFDAHVAGSGLAGALDGVVACSKGESGWWGKGAVVSAGTAGATPTAEAGPPLNTEGVWSLQADDDVCAAMMHTQDGAGMVLIAANGGNDVAVGIGSKTKFKRGRQGLFATDAYSFAFKPAYDGDTYMGLGQFLDSQALFALRRAKHLQVSVDDRDVFGAEVADTGLADLVTALGDCARGEKGWWGEGAKVRRR